MASIRKRTNANGTLSWIAEVRRIGYPAISRSFPSKIAAKLWTDATEKKALAGTLGASERLTFTGLRASAMSSRMMPRCGLTARLNMSERNRKKRAEACPCRRQVSVA